MQLPLTKEECNFLKLSDYFVANILFNPLFEPKFPRCVLHSIYSLGAHDKIAQNTEQNMEKQKGNRIEERAAGL